MVQYYHSQQPSSTRQPPTVLRNDQCYVAHHSIDNNYLYCERTQAEAADLAVV